MALKEGTMAPDFTLEGTHGSFSLSKNLAGKACILYFYPKDFTRGCTAEACEFRDQFSYFRDLDIDVIGISTDTVETHHSFRDRHNLPFELLSDKNGKISRLYEAKMPWVNITKRLTYLLDADHKIVGTYQNLFDGAGHVAEMMAKIKSSASSRK